MIKKLLTVTLFCLFVGTYFSLDAQAATDSSGFTYNEESGNITITGYATSATPTMPKEIGGKKVTKIANNAFKNNAKITSLVLPDGIMCLKAVQVIRQ